MSILTGFTIIKDNVGTLIKNIGQLNTNFKVHTMRTLQKIVFEYWKVQRFLLSSPPGSGKSAIVKFIVSWLLKLNPDLKVIIVVPYLVLTKSFGSIILEYPDGKQIPWEIDLNLCVDTNAESKVDELNNFLTRKANLFSRVAIASHRTLALMNERYPDNNYDNTMFIIDEAHHVLYPEEGNESDSANKIGRLIHSLFDQNNPTVKIWFLTATFYRGDKYSIIPPGMMETFTTYHLPLDEYWDKYIQHIKTFEYNFVIYKKNDVFNEISEIFRTKGKRKTIVYCPYKGNLLERDNKLQFRDKIKKAIRKVWPDCRILDLVQVEGRGEIKDIIIDNIVEFDVVLAVKLFDEGTDWEQAESIIDLFPSNSLRIQVQRFGRLIRDYPGKTHIDYNVFFPYEADFKDDEERRVHMSKCFNAFVASCLLYNAIEPVLHPKLVKKQEDETKPDSEGLNDYVRKDPLSIAFPDETHKQQALMDVFKFLGFMANSNKEPTPVQAKRCIINVLKKLGVKSNFEELAVQIVRMFNKSINLKLPKNPDWVDQTNDVEFMIDAGFDKVWTNEILKELLAYTTNFCGVKDFKEFREIYGDRLTIEEWVYTAENIASSNGGILPRPYKLPPALVQCMLKYPERFNHINQDKQGYEEEEYYLNLEKKILSEKGYFSPHSAENRHNYPSLSGYATKNPELFNSLKTIEKIKQKWRKYAEELEKLNSGVLPSIHQIKKNSNGLYRCMEVNPEVFYGMWQIFGRGVDRKIVILGTDKSYDYPELEHHMILFNKLLKSNQGILPILDFRNKEQSQLATMIRLYPEYFSGIKRLTGKGCGIKVSIINTDIEYVDSKYIPLYDEVINFKDDNGILPSSSSLEYKYRIIIKTHPELFKGQKQYVSIKKNHVRLIGEPDAPLQTT